VRILVTGGAGFIGGHVAHALHARGDVVTVVDDLSSGKRANVPDGVRLSELDIRDPSLPAVFADFRPDAVLHFAAQVSVLASMRDPDFDKSVNVAGSLNVLNAAVQAGVRAFVNVGTGIVYGEPSSSDAFPLVETQAKKLPFPYSQSKYEFEHELAGMVSTRAIAAVTLRPGNVYGPRQDPHGEAGVVAIFSQRLIAGEPLVIHGAGTATRDYVYVGDMVDATLLALDGLTENPDSTRPRAKSQADFAEPGNLDATNAKTDGESHKPLSPDDIAFNVGTGVGTSVLEIADALDARARVRGIAPRDRAFSAARAGEVSRIELDSGKARELLGWTPKVALVDGLALTFDWFFDKNTLRQR
jgi:UDP-glucose 4-epimerase